MLSFNDFENEDLTEFWQDETDFGLEAVEEEEEIRLWLEE